MKTAIWGVSGTSMNLSFLKGVDYVVDDEWNRLTIFRRVFYEFYWRMMLKKPFSKVCFSSSKLKKDRDNVDILYIGDIFRREVIIPKAKELGFILDENMFEAFALSPALCARRRKNVTQEEINKKDYEDDDLKLSIMANMIPHDVTSICDVGCGMRKLMNMISPQMSYVGIDYIQQADNIINIDLNKDRIPEINSDCIFGCGILEFIDDVEGVLKKFARYKPKYFLLSYSPREFSNISTQRSRVYHNCIYSHQITSAICSNGYELSAFKRYESRQAIYLFKKC